MANDAQAGARMRERSPVATLVTSEPSAQSSGASGEYMHIAQRHKAEVTGGHWHAFGTPCASDLGAQ